METLMNGDVLPLVKSKATSSCERGVKEGRVVENMKGM